MSRSARPACVVLAFAVSLVGCEDPDHRADIVVYGDHLPDHTNRGDPFPDPITAQALTGDPVTTAAFKEIPGLRHPRGTASWGVAAWAKYVFLGNYDHKGSGVFQTIEDQRIGLYDSEQKTFCQLDVDPARATNAGMQWLSVASPKARRTRIFYEGIAAPASGGFPFGFITGNLDNPDPCDPATGWVASSRGFRPAELNAAARAVGQPDVCPDTNPADPGDDWCGFDGMAVLHHDDATNTDTVEIGNWMHSRIAIVQIDGADQLRVLKVHTLPLWQPDDGNAQTPDACFSLLPVARPAVDPTRPPTDLRFLQAFDKVCAPADSPGCPSKAVCPITGAACSGSCADSYCSKPLFSTYVRAPAPGATCNGQPVSCSNVRLDTPAAPICLDLGVATRSCLVENVNFNCKLRADNTGGDCACTAPATPVQEYRFNVATRSLEATSFLFNAAPSEGMIVLEGGYSRQGDVFVTTAEQLANKSWRSRIIRYPARADGEHDYRDPAATLASRAQKIIPATGRNYPLKTAGSLGFLSLALAGIEVGNAMYLLSKDAIERDIFGFGQWAHDAQYKLSFGVGTPAATLPQEAFTCAPRAITACTSDASCPAAHTCRQSWCQPAVVTACETTSDCAANQQCPALRCASSGKPCSTAGDCDVEHSERCVSGGAPGENGPHNVELGGAPASLWSSPHSTAAQGDQAHINAYLTRVPVAVDLPGVHTSVVPPALTWSLNPTCATSRCDRLWLFGAPEGSPAGTLHYRTRDQGLWAAGFSPLPSNVAVAGGPAAVYTTSSTAFTDATVEVYARRQSDGRLVRTQLTTAVDCGTGGAACQWAPWQAVTGAPVTDSEPAATIARIDDAAVVFLAVKDAAGQLWIAERRGATLSAWRTIAGLTSDASPALVFNFDDNQVLLFARDRQTGAIRYARVDGGRAGPWTTAGGTGAVLPWSTAPSVAYTGRLRLLVGSGTFPSFTYETTLGNGAWDAWKPITSGAGTTRRPAVANVNGDVNVVTTYVTNLQEQLVK